MKNSTLVYKSAIILLGIVLPFILPAHRFPSFYCKSCIWWYCPYLILRTAEPSSREKNKMKEEIKIFLNFTKEQWRPTLHRNWLKTENCFPPDFKTGWKEILFHQQQHLSPLPVRSTAGWLAKLQNRTPMAPPRTDVCNSNCSTRFLAAIIAREVTQDIPLGLSWDRKRIKPQDSELTSEPQEGWPWQTMMLQESGCTQTIHTNPVGEWVQTHLHVPSLSASVKLPMKSCYWRGSTSLLQIMEWNELNKEAVVPELTGTELKKVNESALLHLLSF